MEKETVKISISRYNEMFLAELSQKRLFDKMVKLIDENRLVMDRAIEEGKKFYLDKTTFDAQDICSVTGWQLDEIDALNVQLAKKRYAEIHEMGDGHDE